MSKKRIGAYLQIYKDDGKPNYTLKHFRKVYPDSPVYVVSDAGADFSELCRKYECKYEHSNFNTGIRRGGFTLQEMTVWNERVRRAFMYCNTEHMLYLEDDVYIRSELEIDQEYEISGFHINDIPQNLVDYIISCCPGAKFNVRKYGACGGTVYRTHTYLDMYEKFMNFFVKHYDYVRTYIGDKMSYLDCGMCVLYMAFGYRYGKNKNMIEPWHDPNWKTGKHPVIHFGEDKIQREFMAENP